MNPRISIVIPTHNRKENLIRCIESLERQTYSADKFEIIVVDDGSTDGTSQLIAEYIKKSTKRLKLISQTNLGPGVARNLGVEYSNGEYLAFIEDDVVADGKWVENAMCYFDTSDIDGLEGKTHVLNSNKSLRVFEKKYNIGFLPCNLFLKKSVFIDAGGYDKNFYDSSENIYFREDADLGFTLLEKSHKFILAGDVTVSHPEQFYSSKDYFRHAKRYYFDPLLHKKHPKFYRRMIESKSVGRFKIRRPFHYLSLLNVINWILVPVFLFTMQTLLIILSVPIFLVTLFGTRYRYQRKFFPHLFKIKEIVSFIILPFYYVYWFFQGCMKFRNWRCIL
jgi:glycosyltransferase involved in cell wall biosynthesis